MAIQAADGYDEQSVLQKLASVERASEHPLAAVVVAAAHERKLQLSPVQDFDSPLGKGVVGLVDGSRVVCGSAGFLDEHGIDVSSMDSLAEAVRLKAATVVFVALDGHLAGFVGIADPIKAGTAPALEARVVAQRHCEFSAGEGIKPGGVEPADAERSLLRRQSREGTEMAVKFKAGDHVSWNSEAGHVSGTIIKVHAADSPYKGYTHHGSPDDPQYEIKSDRTEQIALHKGATLKKLKR